MAIVALFDSCGVRITEIQWREVPYQEGQIRVFSNHGDRLEFHMEYSGVVERKSVIGQALAIASHALDMGV